MSPVRPARVISRARRAAFSAAVLVSAHVVQAQLAFTWNGAGPDGLLSTAANWVGSDAPTSGANTSLTFTDASARFAITVPAGFSTQSITFNSTNAYSFVGSALTLGNSTPDQVVLSANGIGTPNFNHPVSFANPSIVQAINSSIDFNSTVNLAHRIDFNASAGRGINFSGPLNLSSASAVLRAAGPGTINLVGGNLPHAAGASIVATGGTLVVTSATQVPNLVVDGATVRLQAANRLANASDVSVSSGLLETTGAQTGSTLFLSGGTVTSTALLTFAGIVANPSGATPARVSGLFSAPSVTGTSAPTGVALDIDAVSFAPSVTYASPGTATFRFLPGTSISPPTQTVTASGNLTFQLNGGTPATATATVNVPAGSSLTLAAATPTSFLPTVSSSGTLTVASNVSIDNPSALSGTLALTGGAVRLLTAGRLTSATSVSVSSGSLQVSANQTGSALTLSGGSVTGTGTVSFSSLLAAPPTFVGVGQSASTPRLAVPFNIPSVTLNHSSLSPVTLDLDAPSLAPTVTYTSTSPFPNLPNVRFFSVASTTSSVTVSGTGAVLSFMGGSPATNGATFTVVPGARFQLHYQGAVSPLNATFLVSGTLEPSLLAGFPVALRNVSVAPSGTFVETPSVFATTLTNTGSVTVNVGSSLATSSVLNSGVINSTSTQAVEVGTLSNTPTGVVFAVGLFGTVINSGTFNATGTSGPAIVGSFTQQPNAVLNIPTNPATGTASFEVVGTFPGAGLTLNAPFPLPANAALRASGTASFINNSTLSLAGGTLAYAGGIANLNNGSISGFGTLSSVIPAAGLTNNGTFSVTGPLVLTSGAQLFNRLGLLDLAPGTSLSSTTTLTNAATFTLRGATLNANLSNTPSGVTTVSGPINSANAVTNAGLLRLTSGTTLLLNAPLTNSGSLRIDDGILNLAFPGQTSSNSGLITLGADGALTGSGSLNSTGRLTGSGTVGLAFTNAAGGRIEPAANASLTFLSPLTNAGVITLPQGTSAVLLQGFTSNTSSGTLSLAGGSLDTNYTPFTNTRLISGFGSLSASVITNTSSIFFTPGNSVVNANFTNAASSTVSLNAATVTFNGRFNNLGTLDILAGSRAFLPGANLATPLSSTPRPLALTSTSPVKIESTAGAVIDGLDAVLAFTLSASSNPPPILIIPSRQPGGVIPASGRTVPQSVSIATIATAFATILPELPDQLSYLFRVDLADNDMVMRVRPGFFSPSPDDIRSMARNYLASNGLRGIGSSSSLPFTRLAVVPNDTGLGFPRFASFGADLPLVSSDVLLRFTYIGDTDLSGTLDARDFNTILSNWSNNTPNPGWERGDFNYDNVVNATDFQLFLEAYQAFQSGSLPALGSPLDYGTGGGEAIPEPTALALLLPTATLLTRRRRA